MDRLLYSYKPYFTRQQQWLLIALTALAFLLRLHRLNVQNLWFDESLSALFASQPLNIAIQSMLQEGLHHSPGFYILLRPFAASGFSEFSLRFLPAVMGVLAVPLIAQMGRVIAGSQAGLLAAALLVISPFHVWYSQEARMYTLLIVSALGAMFFFSQNFKTSRYKNWLGMAMFIATGINSHHFAFFIPLVQFIFIVITLKQNHKILRPWVGAQLLAGLSLIPWIMIVLDWGHFYLSSATRQSPTGYDLLQTYWNFSIGYTERFTPFVIIALSLFLLLLILGVKSTYRINNGLLLLLWVAIPPLVTFLVSLRLPTYLDRYISLSLPPFLLLAAIGISSIRLRILRLGVLALTIGVMLIGLYRVYYDANVYSRADWRSLSAYLEENAATDDIIAPWYYQYLVPLSFYYYGSTPLEPIISFNVVDLPLLPVAKTTSQKLWVIITHPNNSAHLVGHCQAFDIEKLSPPPATKEWRIKHQDRLSEVKEFNCIRLEIYK